MKQEILRLAFCIRMRFVFGLVVVLGVFWLPLTGVHSQEEGLGDLPTLDDIDANFDVDDFDSSSASSPSSSAPPAAKESALSKSSPKANGGTGAKGKTANESFDEFADEDFDEDFGENQTDDLSFEDFEEPDSKKVQSPKDESDDLQADDLAIDPLPAVNEDPQFPEPDVVAPLPVPQAAPTVTAEEQAPEPQEDPPDRAYEARLHSIYVNFHSAPTPSDQWAMMVGERKAEAYSVQSGDTLWEISEVLFGDGNYWPKIWSVNTNITNPHLIQRGNKIRFIMGTAEDPPAFTVTESGAPLANDGSAGEDQASENQATNGNLDPNTGESTDSASANGEYSAQVEIPPSSVKFVPVLKRIPPSLPDWGSMGRSNGYDAQGFQILKRGQLRRNNSLTLQAYVEEGKTEGAGQVAEIEGGLKAAAENHYVYVTLPQGLGAVGNQFLVINDRGPIQKTFPELGDNLGYLKEITGVVKLTDIVNSTKTNRNTDTFKALVTRSFAPVELGADLVPGRVQSVDLSASGPRSQAVAQIVGGIFDPKRHIFGPLSVVFLNRGSNDGFAEGQILAIRANEAARKESTILSEIVRPIGYLKIAKVTPRLATAVVLSAWEDIRPGDLTGQGPVLTQGQISRLTRQQNQKSGDGFDGDFEGGADADFSDFEDDLDFEDATFE